MIFSILESPALHNKTKQITEKKKRTENTLLLHIVLAPQSLGARGEEMWGENITKR